MSELSPNPEPNANTKAEKQILIEIQNREIPLFKIQTITLFFAALIFFHSSIWVLGFLANALITKEFPANDEAWKGIDEIGCLLKQKEWKSCEGFCDNPNSIPFLRTEPLAFANESKCEHPQTAICIHNNELNSFQWTEWSHCSHNHKKYRKRNIVSATTEATIVVDLRDSIDGLFEEKNC